LFWVEIPLVCGVSRALEPKTEDVSPRDSKPGLPPVGRDDADGQTRGLILLVEDSPTNRLVASTILAAAGFEIVEASDGREAVALASRHAVDLVLMDISMPRMDGIEAARRIRQLGPPYRRLPIIALTAIALEGERERLMAEGIDDYLTKPIQRRELIRQVEHWIARSGAPAEPVPTPAYGTAKTEDEVPSLDGPTLSQLRSDLKPETLANLATTYLRETEERLDRLPAFMAAHNFAAVEGEAHALKGSSRTFGLLRLALAAERLEIAARERQAAEARAALEAVLAESGASLVALAESFSLKPGTDPTPL
jgi:CheY-like chemotaxis protein